MCLIHFFHKIKKPILEWLKDKKLFIGDKIIFKSNLSKQFKHDKKISESKRRDAKNSVIGYTMHVLYELEKLYFQIKAKGKNINKKYINLIIYYKPLQTKVKNVKKQHFKHNELLNCVLSAIAKQKKRLGKTTIERLNKQYFNSGITFEDIPKICNRVCCNLKLYNGLGNLIYSYQCTHN